MISSNITLNIIQIIHLFFNQSSKFGLSKIFSHTNLKKFGSCDFNLYLVALFVGVLFCVGGRGGSGDPFRSIECYSINKNSWFFGPEMNSRRRHVGVISVEGGLLLPNITSQDHSILFKNLWTLRTSFFLSDLFNISIKYFGSDCLLCVPDAQYKICCI